MVFFELVQLVRARDCQFRGRRFDLAKTQQTENSNLHGFELHRTSSKGTRLLFQVIKAIINQCIDIYGLFCCLFSTNLFNHWGTDIVQAKSSGENRRTTVGFVFNLPRPRVNKTKQHLQTQCCGRRDSTNPSFFTW